MAWSIERNFPAAREFFEKSIQINPPDALIANRYGYFLLWMADYNKAAALATRAMQSDPVDYKSYFILIRVHQSTGRLDESARLIREGKRLFPNRKNLTQFEVNNLELSGHYFQVIHLCDSILRQEEYPDPELLANLSIAYFKTKRFRESNAVLEQLKSESSKTNEGACYHAAAVHASRNEPDSCLSWLNKSFDRLETALHNLKIDPVFDPFRNHQLLCFRQHFLAAISPNQST